MKTKIYLDNNATTFVDPRVIQSMLPVFTSQFGNPSSIHQFGQEAKKLLQNARSTIASYLGVKPTEIIFTSGGTESINLLLQGHFLDKKGHILSSNIEHSSVYKTLGFLGKKGCKVTYLQAGELGAVTVEQIEEAITADTSLLCFTAVNSETGVKIDLEKISALAQRKGIPLFIDGVALLGKEPFSIPAGVSAMAFSGHKFHAPKGSGIAFIRSSFSTSPLFFGGSQEYEKRPGTENLPAIVGLAKAVELLREELISATHQMETLRDYFEKTLIQEMQDVMINGKGPRICNTSNLSFLGLDGESLLIHLDLAGVAASHGSACSSGALEPSRILRNMGLEKARLQSSLRFSLSRFTTQEEIDLAIQILLDIHKKLKRTSF